MDANNRAVRCWILRTGTWQSTLPEAKVTCIELPLMSACAAQLRTRHTRPARSRRLYEMRPWQRSQQLRASVVHALRSRHAQQHNGSERLRRVRGGQIQRRTRRDVVFELRLWLGTALAIWLSDFLIEFLSQFINLPGQASCLQAPIGEFVATQGATSSTKCGKGWYQNVPGQSFCLQW